MAIRGINRFMVILFALLLCGCGKSPSVSNEYSTWFVYWGGEDATQEIYYYPSSSKFSVFAVSFNKKGEFTIPNQVTNYSFLGKKGYLTFVNDLPDQSEKSLELANWIVKNDSTRKKYAKEIVELTSSYGFGGVELDFENLGKDEMVWKKYGEFIKLVDKVCQEKGIDLKVVVEPGVPFHLLPSPNSISYVIMCYNLYGSFSGPGPKADVFFINKVLELSSSLKKRTLAFATGGYDWTENRNAKAITEKDAINLKRQYHVRATRHTGAIFFEYKDVSGACHQVWYADARTLLTWRDIGKSKGVHSFAFWRAGGNLDVTLEQIVKDVEK